MAKIWTPEIFSSEPSRAGSIFRQLHAQDKLPEMFQLLYDFQTFAASNPSRDYYDGLFDGNLLQAILAVLLDRRYYDQPRFETDTKRHIVWSLGAVVDLLLHSVDDTQPTSGSHHPANHPPYAVHLLESLPTLWSLLLELPYVLQSAHISLYADKIANPEEFTVRWEAAHLAMLEYKLREMMSPTLGSEYLDTLAPHVIVRCWLFATSMKMITVTERYLEIVYSCSKHNDDIIAFIDKAINLKTIAPRQFVQRCNSRLRNQDVVDDELLSLMSDLWMFCRHEKMVRARAEDTTHVLSLLHATQRQLCHGEQRNELLILEMAFAHILHIMADNVPRFKFMNNFFHSLAMLLGRAMMLVALSQSDSSIAQKGIHHIHDMFDFFATNCVAQGSNDASMWGPECSDFVGSVRQVWRQAYDKLSSLPADMAPQKSTALALWTNFGRQCEIDTNAPAVPALPSPNDRDVWSKDMGCAWRECLCFGEKPHHKLRKCNGCQSAMYCSKKCQRRDWIEGGHKGSCRSSSS